MPSILNVRSRIENINEKIIPFFPKRFLKEGIKPIDIKRFYQLVYLGGLRVGEACGRKYASEKKANPTGMYLTTYIDNYTPNIKNKNELQVLLTNGLLQTGSYPNIADLAKINEKIAVFTITLEKRKGNITREVALPTNPDYEPWTKKLHQYISERQNSETPVFPWTRQEVYPIAKELFKGFTYHIEAYPTPKKTEHGEVIYEKNEKGEAVINPKTGKPKIAVDIIPEHDKDAANHAIRHYRSTELGEGYGMEDSLIDLYFGWVGNSATQRRYRYRRWRAYIAYLLVPRKTVEVTL
jgi:hypothetical protein